MGYVLPPHPDDPQWTEKMLAQMRLTNIMRGVVLGAAAVGALIIGALLLWP